MKVILFMAQTLNGIIARKNYSEDFLSDEHWKAFVALAERTGCLIVGRKTYETVNKLKGYSLNNINAEKIIVSSNRRIKLTAGYLAASSPQDAVKKASQLGYTAVLLSGGGNLNTAFIQSDLINEMIINVEPILLGNGIKVFSEGNFENRLKLNKIKKFKEGIIQLNYTVLRKS